MDELQRLRITFAKGEAVKYLGHLDLHRTWERIFRRAGLPVVHSQGYNPRPRFQMAAALPVGVTGGAELLDLWLAEPVAPPEALARLQAAAPAGLEPLAAAPVALHLPPLQSQLREAEYRAEVETSEPPEAIQFRIEALLLLESLPRRRLQKGRWKSYDLRPRIHSLSVEPGPAPGRVVLFLRLLAGPDGAGRPDEVLDALGLGVAPHRVTRTRLLFAFDK